jgi:uncharacterized protein (TIGR02246 family)
MSFRILLVGLLFSCLNCAYVSGGQMSRDEQEIRDLFDDWIKATTEGNLELAHRCIADDALFFVPGAGEMDKLSFAQAAAGVSPEESPIEFDLESKIRELKVLGDHGYLWVESTLVMTPKNGDPVTKMAGHSLSVLVKRDSRWQILRDANTLAPVPE